MCKRMHHLILARGIPRKVYSQVYPTLNNKRKNRIRNMIRDIKTVKMRLQQTVKAELSESTVSTASSLHKKKQ